MPVSIIIPSYNRASIIGKTLDSVISQTSNDWECIVVDDHSIDETRKVVELYAVKDQRVSYYLNEHKKGAQGARNTGLNYAKFDWVVFFDSDNTMHPEFIETMIQCLGDDIDVAACCASIINVDTGETGRVMNPRCVGNIHNKLFTGQSYVDFNQAVIRKSRILEIGGLDEDCPSMQEWDTHIRLSRIASYSMTDNSLVDYYQGGKDTISSNSRREVIGRLYILRKHNTEWRRHFVGLTRFCFEIFVLIQRDEDVDFKSARIKELRSLVPFYYLRMSALRVWNMIK